jgi:hypothetical protein
MLATFFLWILLAMICGLIGNIILSIILKSDDRLHISDLFLYSQWLGILTLSSFMYCVSFVSAIHIYHFLALGVFTLLLSFSIPNAKQNLVLLSHAIQRSWKKIIYISPLFLFAALYSSQIIFWGDTGGYHWSLIKWASEVGTVPGIGLLFDRFGLGSAWFSTHAIFNHGILMGRVGAIVNGYILALVLCNLIFSFLPNKNNAINFNLADRFVFIGYLIVLPLVFRWGMLVSASPDIPVIMAIILAGHIYLNTRISSLSASLLVLTISVFAFNIKFSAIPLLFIAASIFLINNKFKFDWNVIFLIGFGTLPILIGNLLITGYPLFPSTFLQFNLPWQVDLKTAQYIRKVVFDSAFYGPAIWPYPELHPISFYEAILQWATSRYEIPTVILLLSNCVLFPILIVKARSNHRLLLLLAVAVFGIFFFLLNAPTLRFGVQWMLIIPAVFGAYFFPEKLIKKIPLNASIYISTILGCVLIGLIIFPLSHAHQMLLTAIKSNEIKIDANPRFNFILPPPIISIDIGDIVNGRATSVKTNESKVANDLTFPYYRSSICWDAPLPCGTPEKNTKLKNPELGVSGGFIRDSNK